MTTAIGEKVPLPTTRTSHMSFPSAYLDLTSAHSKGQGQGPAHLDCEYLGNGSRFAHITFAIK